MIPFLAQTPGYLKWHRMPIRRIMNSSWGMAVDLLGGPEFRLRLLDSYCSSLWALQAEADTVYRKPQFIWLVLLCESSYSWGLIMDSSKKESSHSPLSPPCLYVLCESFLLNTNSQNTFCTQNQRKTLKICSSSSTCKNDWF